MAKRIRVIYPVWINEKALLEDVAIQIPKELISPGIEVEFMCTGDGATLGDSYYDILLMDTFVLEAGLRAAADGVDAICINTISDSGVNALRSRLTIPVIGPGLSSFHVACMLGRKFSIVTMWDRWFTLYRRTLDEYGLWHRLASMRAINKEPDAQKLLAGKEEDVFPQLEAESLKAIEDDGAAVIVLGSTTMHRSHDYLRSRLPVPVINPGQVAHKICEMFLDLGLLHSKLTYREPLIPKDELLINTLALGGIRPD